ncbi:MAG: hypothetical protein K2H09_00545, partial [Treponemataceae bacterium]|nr:hypothetical protein [Treponemataceae bacterium]
STKSDLVTFFAITLYPSKQTQTPRPLWKNAQTIQKTVFNRKSSRGIPTGFSTGHIPNVTRPPEQQMKH